MKTRPDKTKKDNAGFTLVEFAIVMIISGLLLVMGLQTYHIYSQKRRLDLTFERLDQSSTAVANSFGVESRYFCPADPQLSPADPLYGVEKCPDPAVTAVGSCDGGVCRGAGGRVGGLGNDAVLIGAVPFKTIIEKYQQRLKAALDNYTANPTPQNKLVLDEVSRLQLSLGAQSMLDGWSNKITYVVTETMTSTSTFEDRAGTVRIVDEGNNNSSRDGVHFTVISHGVNGYGAYNPDGFIPYPCPGAAVSPLESENCNNDGVIIRPIIWSFGKNASEIDDMIRFVAAVDSALWDDTTCSGITGSDQSCILNKNVGNVGIGTNAPADSLHIIGDLRTDKALTDLLCRSDAAPNTCFAPAAIGGEQSNPRTLICPASATPGFVNVAKAVKNGALVCELVAIPGFVVPGTYCVDGSFVIGFTDSGGLKCAPL